jgi:hypothetical protein
MTDDKKKLFRIYDEIYWELYARRHHEITGDQMHYGPSQSKYIDRSLHDFVVNVMHDHMSAGDQYSKTYTAVVGRGRENARQSLEVDRSYEVSNFSDYIEYLNTTNLDKLLSDQKNRRDGDNDVDRGPKSIHPE